MIDRKKVYDTNYKIVKRILVRIAPTMSIRGYDPDWSLWSHGPGKNDAKVETVGNDFMGLLAISLGYDWLWEFDHPVARLQAGARHLEESLESRDKMIGDLHVAMAKASAKRRSK